MTSSIGTAVVRADGPIKVTGQARYTADQHLAGQLHGVLVPSTIPAGRVAEVDTRAALAMPGVLRVLTSAAMPRVSPAFAKLTAPPLATRFIPMQDDRIIHEGQAVAMVLGETLEAAEAGAAAVRVRYERAPFVAPADTPAVAADTKTKGAYPTYNKLTFDKGDAATALGTAAVGVNETYSQPSRHGNPMEPSATLAVWEGGRLTVYDAVQHLPAVQNVMAAAFGIAADKVRIVSPHTGGGFGVKGFVWPHEILAAMAAQVVHRPVKLVLTRQQMYGMVGPQPHAVQAVRLGAARDGKLAAISHHLANVTGVTEDYVEFGTLVSRSYYASANISVRQEVRRGKMTLPTFMRSPWDGPGAWALGSAMDELAHALGMDPLDLRLANFAEVDPDSGKPWSSNKLRDAYAEGARRFGWRARPKGGTRDGHWRIGCGVADSSQGQSRTHSTARVRLRADGTASVESSFCDVGTGPATVMPQIAAEILGLAPSRVVAVAGDSDLPFAGPTYGSATTLSTGSAVQKAAIGVRDKLARLAGWPADGVVMQDGKITRGDDSRRIEEVLNGAGVSELASDGSFDLPGGAPADNGAADAPARTFGVIFVEVSVDPDLGLLRLRRATGVYSAGRIINPRTARSQMIGGITWGWGMAAMEGTRFDARLGRWLSKDLAGVPLPVNADIPPAIDIAFIDEVDEVASPLGAKGIGEVGATGVAAAVANAVFDAIGVRVRDLPITPDKLVMT